MNSENSFFLVKIRRHAEQANGKVKKITESYLVEAVSVTDAEVKMTKENQDDPFEWSVKSVTETNILKVIK